jgi:hypothetical protein
MNVVKSQARKITVLTKENPRRPKSAAFKFFTALEQSKTVGEYLKKFERDKKKRRDAGLWMNTSKRQGFIKLAG